MREAIADLRLKPGQRLLESDLVRWMGVSRGTIREAIRELVAEGLVTAVPQKGAVVAAPSREEASDLFELWAIFEGMVIRRFVERADEQQRCTLVRAYQRLKGVPATSVGASEARWAKHQYYEALFDGSGNTTISDVLRNLHARVGLLGALASRVEDHRACVAGLGEVVAAIARGDATAAEGAGVAHVRSVERATCAASGPPPNAVRNFIRR